MTTHNVPSDVFDKLAAGNGDTLGVLRAGQRSKRLLLLHEVVSTARSHAPESLAEANAETSLAVLIDAQRRSPSTVDELILQPHIGAWGMHCLGTLLSDNEISPADVGHLGAIAACAALRADQAFEVTAYLRDGAVMFPSLGMARLGTAQGWCRIRSRPAAAGVEISAGGTTLNVPFKKSATAARTWLHLRRLRSRAKGLEVNVHLDDLDPYRGCGHLPASGRLDEAAVEDWQAKLDEAWALLVRDHPAYAEAIAAGVVSFVPLVPSPEKPELSATCHQAIGAMAMTPPQNPVSFALALVHEFQHTKLSALLDLVPLTDGSRNELFYAPWRSDPRPLRGLIQGAYAYLGVTAFWEGHRYRGGGSNNTAGNDLAHFEFALWRDQLARVVDTLQRSGRLTGPGQRFLGGVEQRLSQLLRMPVPATPQTFARMACRDHALSWRLRNLRPNSEQVAAWTDAWIANRTSPPSGGVRISVADTQRPMPSDARVALFRHRLGFKRRRPKDIENTSPADVHLVEGRLVSATDAYRVQISRSPDDLAAWAGLALVNNYTSTGGARALTTCPERVHALYLAVLEQTGTAPNVEDLAKWMSHGNI